MAGWRSWAIWLAVAVAVAVVAGVVGAAIYSVTLRVEAVPRPPFTESGR